MIQEELSISTPGRGTINITEKVRAIVHRNRIETGLVHIFCRHTSASLILSENADPQVRGDQEAFFSQLVPDGDPMFKHRDEGPDDMAAHLRTTLTDASLTIPIIDNSLGLGTWQGLYLWEHRHAAHRRELIITLNGYEQID